MLLTVFTPTYNRRELLGRAYASLVKQTSHDFIWLIVDDGSKDGTGDFVKELSEKAPFEIRYHYRENGGKMRAHNTGAALCDTELFLCLDSDDELPSGTVQRINETWNRGDKTHTGIVAYKGELVCGEVVLFRNAQFPMDKYSSDSSGAKSSTLRGLYRNGFFGETTLVLRTDLLLKYPFPEIEGEKYVPEDYIYDKIDTEGEFLIIPEIFTVCELVEGGYTDQVKKLRECNPTGWFLYYEQRSRIEKASLLKIKYISHYMRFCHVLKKRCDLPLLWRIAGFPGYVILGLMNKT